MTIRKNGHGFPHVMEDGEVRTVCRFCLARCPVTLRIEGGRIAGVRPDTDIFCEKGQAIGEIVHAPDRLRQPMLRQERDWRPVAWPEALDYLADKVGKIIRAHRPGALHVHLGQSQVLHLLSKEYAARFCTAIGGADLSSSGSQCSVSRNMGNVYTYGYLPFPDYAHTACVVVWGANPENTNAFNLRSIENAVSRGARLIVVDPRKTSLARRADVHLQLNPGTDRVLAMGIISILIKEGLYDRDFTAKWTYGFDKLEAAVSNPTPERAASVTGVEAGLISEAARLYAQNRPASVLTGNSLEHHPDGFQAVRAVAIMQAVAGNLEVPGGNIINSSDVHRHRVREDSSAGATALGSQRFPLYYRATGEAQANLLADAILQDGDHPVRGLIIIGGNPALSFPDSGKMSRALDSLDLLVVMDHFMTATARHAQVVLPATTMFERFDLCNLSPLRMETRISLIPPSIAPQGEAWPEWQFWSELGKKMGFQSSFSDIPVSDMMAEQAKRFGLTAEDLVNHPQGITVNSTRYHGYLEKGFPTDSGKVEIYSEPLRKAGYDPVPSTEEAQKQAGLVMVTGSKLREYMISRYRNILSLRARRPLPLAEVSPLTAEKYGIKSGDAILVATDNGELRIQASVSDSIKDGVVYLPVGWEEADVNTLNGDDPLDPVTGFPVFKSRRCSIAKA